MITSILVNFFGVLSFLYFFWRRLKEDYPSNEIFSTAFFMLAGILTGSFVSRLYFPEWFFWTGFLGAGLGFSVGLLRFQFRFHESLEAAGVSFLPWLGLLFLGDSTANSSVASLFGFLICIFLIGGFFVLDIHYKKLTWYRSGRVGFAGLAVTGFFFLIRAVVAAIYPHVITVPGRFDAIISSIVAFAFFLVIYNLAKSEV